MRLIPRSSLPTPLNGKWDLKIVIKVGTLGFKRSEIYRAGQWGPDTEFWVDNDTTCVEFYKLSPHSTHSSLSSLIFSLSF